MRIIIALFFLLSVSTVHAQLSPEQKLIKKTFTDFMQFYLRNANTFNAFDLYKGTGPEERPPYHIYWKGVEKYFAYLRTKVPYVGEAYIASERTDFKYYDSCFKADPEEEMPVGFDYDRWGGGQESAEYMVKWHTDPQNIYQIKITGNKATLRIGYPLWEGSTEKNRLWSYVFFTKEKGRWKMASNITPEDQPEEPAENE